MVCTGVWSLNYVIVTSGINLNDAILSTGFATCPLKLMYGSRYIFFKADNGGVNEGILWGDIE